MHRLVASVFLGSVAGNVVNHKNRDRADNRAENLEIISFSENLAHYLSDDLLKLQTAGASAGLLSFGT